MVVRTVVRDCLFLNWAFPRELLADPPSPLRYEVHEWNGDRLVFGSALLFWQKRLTFPAFPVGHISFPQLNLRFYVTDEEGLPSVLFRKILVPAWVRPSAQLTTGMPIKTARFEYPKPSDETDAESWRWEVARSKRLVVEARPGESGLRQGPDLGSSKALHSYIGRRTRGYGERKNGLVRIEKQQDPTSIVPVRAEVERIGLLARLGKVPEADWPELHSAWLCPEMAITFALDKAEAQTLPRQVPAPG